MGNKPLQLKVYGAYQAYKYRNEHDNFLSALATDDCVGCTGHLSSSVICLVDVDCCLHDSCFFCCELMFVLKVCFLFFVLKRWYVSFDNTKMQRGGPLFQIIVNG